MADGSPQEQTAQDTQSIFERYGIDPNSLSIEDQRRLVVEAREFIDVAEKRLWPIREANGRTVGLVALSGSTFMPNGNDEKGFDATFNHVIGDRTGMRMSYRTIEDALDDITDVAVKNGLNIADQTVQLDQLSE